MRVLVVGDIGTPDEYRAAEEQMALAAVQEITRRLPCEVVVVGGARAGTTNSHGWSVVPHVGFAADRTDAERDARLDALLAAARGDIHALGWDRPEWSAIHAVAEADAVLITGGTNLNSSWPAHVYERAAIAQLALAFERPLVASGQTVGPHLTARHGELVGRVTSSAALVGVRDEASLEVCRALGVRPEHLMLTDDDAVRLRTPRSDAWTAPEPQYVVGSFTHHSGMLPHAQWVEHLARLVDHAAQLTGLPVVLVPYEGDNHGRRSGDVALHDEIRARASSTVYSLDVDPGVEPAAARGAALALASRPQAVVYALASGVPSLAIGTDSGSLAAARAATESLGMGDFALGVPTLLAGGAPGAVDELWQRRDKLRSHLLGLSEERQAHRSLWWDMVAEVLQGRPAALPQPLPAAPPVGSGPWSHSARAADDWMIGVDRELIATKLAAEALRDTGAQAQGARESLELQVAELQAELDGAAEEIALLRASVRSTHELAEVHLEVLAEAAATLPQVGQLSSEITSLRAELEAVRQTHMFRYLAPARRAWARVRPGRGRD